MSARTSHMHAFKWVPRSAEGLFARATPGGRQTVVVGEAPDSVAIQTTMCVAAGTPVVVVAMLNTAANLRVHSSWDA